MELKQYPIHRKYKKAEAKSQITIGDDYSVPEGKPDIAEILQKKADFHVEEVHTEKGKVRVRGRLKLSVLYLAERAMPAVASVDAEFPFDEVLYMEGAASGDNLRIDWNIEELRVTLVHPGKLGVRAIVTIYGRIAASPETLLTENLEEISGVCTRRENFPITEPVMEHKDSYRIRDEVLLPVNKPNVRNVLWKDLQLRGLDLRLEEGRVAVKGETLLFVVYESEEEQGAVQWFEQAVPFHGILTAVGITPEMFSFFETEAVHQEVELKPDYDGELRMFQIELLMDIHMHIFETRTCRVLNDAYSTRERLVLQREETAYESLRMLNQMKCRVSGQENAENDGGILQILGHHAALRGRELKASEEGIVCSGTLEIQVLYITANDSAPFGCAVLQIPYSQPVEAADTVLNDMWEVHEMIDQVFITMPESGRIEVRAVILMNICVMEQGTLQNIIGVNAEAYDMQEYKKRPGMCIHFVQPKENLWTIAKKNRSTVDNIKKLNDISADEVTPGQKLILLKQAAESLS